MAIQRYNHTILEFLKKSVVETGMKAMLLNSSATFNATHTLVTQVNNAGAYEVSGNGWDLGGEVLADAAWAIYNTNGAWLDASDISVLATGGAIGPASAVLILYGTLPLFFQSFASPQEAGDGTPMLLRFNANGIVRVVPA